jgi:hypothetical protein
MKLSSYAEKLISRQSARAATGPATARTPSDAGCPAALAAFPNLMTTGEVAGYLNISADLVLLLRDGGELEFINIGTPGRTRPRWRITRASLAAFEARRRTASAT